MIFSSAAQPGSPPRVRFFGWKAAQLSQSPGSETSSLWSAPINGSLVSTCAQEVFASFITSMLDIVNGVGPVGIQEAEPFRLENSLVTEIVGLFTEMGLASRQEALFCVIHLMLPHLKMPPAASTLAVTRKSATQQRRRKEWKHSICRIHNTGPTIHICMYCVLTSCG